VIVTRLFDPNGILPERWQTFTIELQDIPEGPFDDWRHRVFSAAQLLDPAVAGPDADPDHDDLRNVAEYALGTPPLDGNNPPTSPHLGEIDVGGKKYLTLTYRQRPATFDPDLSVSPFISGNLMTWECGPAHFITLSQVLISPDLEELTLRAAISKDAAGRQLVRLIILR
jgi:hypothetical protein